jgi:ribose 5-phosphate isomerase A
VRAEVKGAVDAAKRAAAESAATLVEDGMRVGLGTGSTVAFLLPALATRHLKIRCVATSPATASEARRLGLEVEHFDHLDRLDIAIDGADQVDAERWLVKGGGGAHTREKIVAAAADQFVVIVSPEKLVPRLQPPVPVELMAFGLEATLKLLPGARVRAGAAHSPDGGIIADWVGEMDDLEAVAARLAAVPGVVEHGLFPPDMVTDVIVGRPA